METQPGAAGDGPSGTLWGLQGWTLFLLAALCTWMVDGVALLAARGGAILYPAGEEKDLAAELAQLREQLKATSPRVRCLTRCSGVLSSCPSC